jgi:hypothetical protein
MKKTTILAISLLTMSCTSVLLGQTVTLGDATFEAASDQIAANWYHPMTGTRTLVASGTSAGGTLTESFALGESVGGVKCLKRHLVQSAPGAADVTEDWWLAIDTRGDVLVLKCSGTKLAAFDAFIAGLAPLYLPGKPAQGQTWELFGRTQTVVSVVETGSCGNLVIKSEAVGTAPQTSLYWASEGLASYTSGTGSWNFPAKPVAPAGE